MKNLSMAALRTTVEIALWRHGWAWPMAAVLAGAAILGHRVILQPERQGHESAQLERAQEQQRHVARASGSVPSRAPDAQDRLQVLQAVLRQPAETSEMVRKMAALAQAEQINLAQSEYQQQVNAAIGLTRVQVSQPVRASYPQLRRYVEAVLRALPNASLDQIVARRENVGQTQVEAQLKWSLWIYDGTPGVAAAKDGTP